MFPYLSSVAWYGSSLFYIRIFLPTFLSFGFSYLAFCPRFLVLLLFGLNADFLAPPTTFTPPLGPFFLPFTYTILSLLACPPIFSFFYF